jgi:hypothetical protein
MSVAIIFHTNLDIAELEKRLVEIRARHINTLDAAFSFSNAMESDDIDDEVLHDAGVSFKSISNFSISNRKGNRKLLLKDGVELLKKEFSDVDFSAMHQNEKLM